MAQHTSRLSKMGNCAILLRDVWTKKNENGESVLDYVQAKLVDLERYETRDNPTPTMLVVDSKTVQNADTAEEKGYDGGKKIGCEDTYSRRCSRYALCNFDYNS